MMITTEEVLTEQLNFFGERGTFLRNAAARLAERMHADASIRILPKTHEGFLAGFQLYLVRPDKGYGLNGLHLDGNHAPGGA